MADLIERQAAIDAVKSYWKAEVDAIPKDADFGTVTATCDLILKCNTEMCKVLDGIPSAQPKEVFEIGKPHPLKGYDFCIFKDAYGEDWVVIKKYINDIEEG